ncbi:Alpha/Beta hydrolase protein [Panaeolus papilionaceus]|nr:Alpha/Beta hydrolase protein [Panaeolus papilionaceus]
MVLDEGLLACSCPTTTRTLPLLPAVLVLRLVVSPLNPQEKKKPWRRIVSDALLRWVIFSLEWKHSKILFVPTLTSYKKWCKKKKIPLMIEDVKDESESKLLWLGNKDAKKVILYFHGGGYSWPMQECALDFWRFVRQEVGKGIHNDWDVAVAILTYTLLPEGAFPTPLRQATNGIQTLLDRGISPQDIQLTGDSAGGNLIVQVLVHMLHPYKNVSRLPESTKFGGAYLMSPWTVMKAREGVRSWKENDRHDIVCARRLEDTGQYVLDSVTEKSMMPYIDMTFAPGRWYDGIDTKVNKILITAGDAECLRDDILEFADRIGKVHRKAEIIVQDFGVHDDPFYDFMAGEEKLVDVTKEIVNWFIEGYGQK